MPVERPGSTIARREFLTIASTGGVASLAGCQKSEGGTDRGDITVNASSTGEGRDPSPERAETEYDFDVRYLGRSPSSHIGPTDGFADARWLKGSYPSVLVVTNLQGTGVGSLRWAISQTGPRVVVFEVGGVVDLGGQPIVIKEPDVYIAGQTAPPPGITVVRGAFTIAAENVILQHLSVRPGDRIDSVTDCVGTIDGGSNVIVDHCSASWGTDETISTNSGHPHPDITFSNNLATECLADSIHPKGIHSYGTLVMDHSRRVTVAGNLWAHNIGRHPRLKGGSRSVVVNNVTYNFEEAVRLGGGVETETVSSVVGNVFREGKRGVTPPLIDTKFGGMVGPVSVYEADNVLQGSDAPTRPPSSQIRFLDRPRLWPARLTAMATPDVFGTVVRSVGARPADRQPTDNRIINDVLTSTGSVIDSQQEVGGYPDHPTSERSLEIPNGDLAPWLDRHTKSVELGEPVPP